MAKIMKKKAARPVIPPKYPMEDKRVPIKSFMDGIVVRLLRGLKSLNVLKPDMFCI